MDLKKYDLKSAAAKGVTVHLKDPVENTGPLYDGEGEDAKPVTVTCYGRDADEWKKAQKEVKAERARNGESNDLNANFDDLLDQIVKKCIISWQGMSLGAKELKCTKENIDMVYRDYPWVFEQLRLEVINRSNYFLA